MALGRVSGDGIALISLRREMCVHPPLLPLLLPRLSSFFLFILRIRYTIYVDNCASREKIARGVCKRISRCRLVVLKRQRDIDAIVKKINFNEINSRRSGGDK